MGFKVNISGFGSIECEMPLTGAELLSLAKAEMAHQVVACRVNHYLRPLSWVIDGASDVEFVDTGSFEGMEVYRRTLSFLLVMASKRALGQDVIIRHSMSDGYYCELVGGEASQGDVEAIRGEMKRLIDLNIPINREVLPLDRAKGIFERQGNLDKARLLKWTAMDPVVVYRCADTYGYFYAPLASNTGQVKVFDLLYYPPGMVLQFPTISFPDRIPPFQAPKSLAEVFIQYSQWLDVLGVTTMDSIHERVTSGRGLELILISEALHGEALARVSREICDRPDVRLVCLAGPSGSGKTTTARRLMVQLQVCGKRPVAISLDDYFVDREKTPRDENGNYDFEALEALDVEQINQDLSALLEGQEVQLPKFDFLTGRRKKGKRIKVGSDDVIIIEGIHGLNEKLTRSIPEETKYKIFVSPLTGVSLDRHNRTSTTDNRLLRRLVRDHRVRGHSPESTLLMWPSVIRGSHRHIFPYQERADVMFNTALVYELPVLKGYAEPLLRSVPEESPAYGEAQRLLSMLRFVPFIPSDDVPNISILREFIGGSCFED
ncbi:AAA ATPase [Thermanaerovibrio acidaminovorans DSM 6589]|uniref:AAA ATPase n=1 Tax=Thermanaerovibrio acidaminovorans (strain ATCC 49978 / DSM 6589 / Su883) TaxID=525903 RepID=D1B6F1_THEAS|nr:nucleoside kinase [Thermanaerovibrio acidaminovorans]ACZ19592.1 AAA ATPase [Thermanaerovibrio acidaminovorans DSM 6589]